MKVLVLGAGQLARMMALAGAPLNLQVSAFDVRTGNIVEPVTQSILAQGLEQGIKDCDVITAEFEHVAPNVLTQCQASGKFLPGETAILTGGDRRLEKALLNKAKVANAKYQVINNRADLDASIENIGLPLILKSALDGYDGKGQWRLKEASQIDVIWQDIERFLLDSTQGAKQCIIAEEFVPFDREVSLIGARSASGEVAIYPLTENIHHEGILAVSLAVAGKNELQAQAEQMFKAVADELDYVGVLAIEFFDVQGKLLVNEIAPRVHNSGHWTQQGAHVCQFENHLRAVCGLPLGDAHAILPTVMVNMVGEVTVPRETMRHAHVHWYNKEPRPARKIGHINLTAADQQALKQKLVLTASQLDSTQYPALESAISIL